MQELLQPVVERAREAAIKEAESNAITNVTAQLVAQAQGHEGEGVCNPIINIRISENLKTD